jgi:hypothetical protein
MAIFLFFPSPTIVVVTPADNGRYTWPKEAEEKLHCVSRPYVLSGMSYTPLAVSDADSTR